jgi:mono/diheme cytochrome c family protein
MGHWTDLFLALPLPESWLEGLLFLTFGLHLLFVLLMLGTAMLGFVFFLKAWLERDAAGQLWNKKVVTTHLGLKSLAVVLGVGPLLLIQVRYSHAFFTATGLFAYAWLAVIPLLIVAFLTIDAFGHKIVGRPWLPLLCGILGLGALLTVPAIFTGALSLMERQGFWPDFAAKGPHFDAVFSPHWLLRYLHILGAALVFGAAFHLFFSAKDQPGKAERLRLWLLGGTLLQVVIGIPLVFSVAEGLDWPVLAAVTIGAGAAMLALWSLRPAEPGAPTRSARALLVLLPVLFVSMLAARQLLQDRALATAHALAREARADRSKALTPYREAALAAFKTKLSVVYDNGETIFAGACQPCHGQTGRGDGPAARRLLIPAEDLSAIRADRAYLYGILQNGTNGSGMPYFRFFDRDKLERLLDTLGSRFAMFDTVPTPARPAADQAKRLWDATCSTCHGPDGGGSAFGRTLLPAPPDLRHFSLTPERALAVITDGYPGTVMQPYRDLPESVRQDLAGISNGWRAATAVR